jgi:death on curing protein
MSEPVWVPARAIHIIHDRQIARHGGASRLCDGGLLQKALQRPGNKRQYENADIFESAADYAFGIAKAHAFVDGNKRTAFVSSVTFLRLNGWHCVTEPAEGVEFMEGFASDQISEGKFKSWLSHGSNEII